MLFLEAMVNRLGCRIAVITGLTNLWMVLLSCSGDPAIVIDENYTKDLAGNYKYTQKNLSYQVEYDWTITRINNKSIKIISEMSYTIYSGDPEIYRDTIDNVVLSEPDKFKFSHLSTGKYKYQLDAVGQLDRKILDVKLLTTWTMSPLETYQLKLAK